MNLTDYEAVADALLAKAREIENSKRPSYTIGDEDVLRNFKRDAAMAGITPHQNWLTHFLKQTAAIARWARTPDDPQSEPIEQRLADVVNYCRLGAALAAETPKVWEQKRDPEVVIASDPKHRYGCVDPNCAVCNFYANGR